MVSKRKHTARYHHGDLRHALIDAAWIRIGIGDTEEFSLRALAVSVGVSHGAPAHHFTDKAGLLNALRIEGWTRFSKHLEAAKPHGLHAVGRAYIEFARQFPKQMRLMFEPSSDAIGTLSSASFQAWNILNESVQSERQARGILKSKNQDPHETSITLSMAAWSGVHGFAVLVSETHFFKMDPIEFEAFESSVLDVFVAGILAVPQSQKSR